MNFGGSITCKSFKRITSNRKSNDSIASWLAVAVIQILNLRFCINMPTICIKIGNRKDKRFEKPTFLSSQNKIIYTLNSQHTYICGIIYLEVAIFTLILTNDFASLFNGNINETNLKLNEKSHSLEYSFV